MPLCGRNTVHAAGNTLQAATRVGGRSRWPIYPRKISWKFKVKSWKEQNPGTISPSPIPFLLRAACCVLRAACCVLRAAC